jgi:hypothetical protein
MSGRLRDKVEAEANRIMKERLGRARRAIDEALATLSEPLAFPLSPGEWGAAEGTGHFHVVRDSLEAMARGDTQREIMTALLDAGSALYPRAALFAVKGGAFTGWAGLGFLGEGGFRSEEVAGLVVPADGHHLLTRSVQGRGLVTAGNEGPGEELVRALGGVRPREASAAPILVRGRPVAILYGDSGAGDDAGHAAGFEIVARFAGLAIERLVGGGHRERAATGHEDAPAPAQRGAVRLHGPGQTVAPTPPEEAELQAILGEMTPQPRRDTGDDALPEDDRRRLADARRFARLLVSELVLYNEEAVVQGRKHRDLYSRLKKEIDRSRQAYEARLPAHVSGAAEHFDEELVRVLAQGDPALLGRR